MSLMSIDLPDGRILDVDVDTVEEAQEAGRAFMRREQAQQRLSAEDAQRGPVGNFMKNIADGTTQLAAGIPVLGGLVDEGNALVRSGGGLWGDYDQELAYERERQAQAAQRSPAATVINTVAGGLAGGAAMIPAKAYQGANAAIKIGKATGVGGVLGAGEGFTRGEGGLQNRMEAMPGSAGFGAAFGFGVPVIGKMVGGLVNAFTQKAGRIPTTQEIKEIARQGYERAKNAGLVFSPETWNRVVDDIATAAQDYGIGGKLGQITKRANPTTSGMVNLMEKSKGAAPDFMDVERMKRVAFNTDEPAAPMIGGKLKRAIDESTADDYIAGNVDEGLEGINQGRENWARASRAKTIDKAVRNAQLDNATRFTQAGYEHSLRTRFKEIAKSDDFQYWPKAEQDAVLKVVNGSLGQNLLRLAGAASPKGGLSTMFNFALTSAAPPIGIPFALGTTAARIGATKMGVNNAKIANALVKAGERPKPTKTSRISQQIAEQLLLSQSGRAGERVNRGLR